MRVAVAGLLFGAAAVCLFFAVRGLPSRLLQNTSRLAAGGSLLTGLLVLLNPFGRGASTQQSATVGENSSAVIQQVNNGNAITGDTTTTAEQRYLAALQIIGDDYPRALAVRIDQLTAIESLPPEPFVGVRRPNETGAAFADRSRAAFDRYVADLEAIASSLYTIDTTKYVSHQRDLGHRRPGWSADTGGLGCRSL